MVSEQLVASDPAVRARAVADFTAWVADHHRTLLNFAQLVAGDASTGEDLLQIALARAYLKWSKISARHEHPLSYVRRIIVNENASLWRRAWKRRERPTGSVRIGGLVLAIVVLLVIPAAAGLWRFVAGTDESPVFGPAPSPGQTSTVPKTVNLDLGHLSQGAAPEVSTVRGKSVWLPSGETVKLPTGQFGSVAEYGSGVAWLTRTGGEVRLNVSSERLPSAASGSDVTGVEPGPRGSVMIRTKAGPVFLTSAGKLLAPSQPELRTNRIVATADAIWVDNRGQVVRIPMADLESGSFKAKSYPQWQKVVLGDPRADRVLLINELGCQTLVNGSTAESVWVGCDWQLNAFSSDGRFGVGRSVMYGTIGIIDLNTDKLALGINPDMTPVGPDMVFDEADRLNFSVGNPASGGPVDERSAFMACDLAGQCWFSTARYADPIDFVLPNRK